MALSELEAEILEEIGYTLVDGGGMCFHCRDENVVCRLGALRVRGTMFSCRACLSKAFGFHLWMKENDYAHYVCHIKNPCSSCGNESKMVHTPAKDGKFHDDKAICSDCLKVFGARYQKAASKQ